MRLTGNNTHKTFQAGKRMLFLSLAILGTSMGTPLSGSFPSTKELQASAYVYPIMAARFSSGFGMRKHPLYKASRHHRGIDLAAPHEAPIRAIRSGTVVFADQYAGYGKLIVLLHDDGLTSHYGHCDSIAVDVGKDVPAGHIIGRVGSTGKVTGPHLHFEIRKNGVAQDPEQYLPGLKSQALG